MTGVTIQIETQEVQYDASLPELPELKKCNLHQVQKPIQTSTGNVFVLKDGKWQLAKK